jgi:LuxR family transcriptional regulator of csgAB operon
METDIHIVGPRKLQNKFMASFLQRTTGLKCTCSRDQDLNPVVDQKHDRSFLILLDCLGNDLGRFWIGLGVGLNARHNKCLIALFNVSPLRELEYEAIKRGVRGIFFENDPPDMFTKGVPGILKGELWFSREALIECLLRAEDSKKPLRQMDTPLTLRQTDILLMVASGLRNAEIAERLCISQYTVKAHLHNIYGKICVPNRFQAAIWASKNF